jgi:hypothetical protein
MRIIKLIHENATMEKNKTIYVYTQHGQTAQVIKEACGNSMVVLSQDRAKGLDDILRQIRTDEPAILYSVLPLDMAIELKQKVPQLVLRLLQLDGRTIEQITGKPYDPKSEYPPHIVRAALKVIEIRDGVVKYFRSFEEMISEIIASYRKIAIFNDVMREGIKIALERLSILPKIKLVKTCDGDASCVEVNPLGFKSGYRISFTGTGKLSAEQIAEALLSGAARVYYVEVVAEEVPLCGQA